MKYDQVFDEVNYQAQMADKVVRITSQFAPYCSHLSLESFPSALSNYRMRAEFRVWHENDEVDFVMFDKESKQIIKLQQFSPASLIINRTMLILRQKLMSSEILKKKLFQVDFLSTLSGELLISLIYHKQLDDFWINEAKKLKNELSSELSNYFHDQFKKVNVDIVGRARKQKIEVDRDYVIEIIPFKGKHLIYKQVENSFTQPNAQVAISMLEWADKQCLNAEGDLLELYCGNGNFSIALANRFEKILATEISSTSVDAAQFNIEENGVNNLKIIRLSAEEFTEAMTGVREFRRLKGIDLKSYNCHTVLVDPPRQGLDPKSVELVRAYDKIIYISCNPDTLLENIKSLSNTHKVDAYALFDQFPYTHHVECGVVLKRI